MNSATAATANKAIEYLGQAGNFGVDTFEKHAGVMVSDTDPLNDLTLSLRTDKI